MVLDVVFYGVSVVWLLIILVMFYGEFVNNMIIFVMEIENKVCGVDSWN